MTKMSKNSAKFISIHFSTIFLVFLLILAIILVAYQQHQIWRISSEECQNPQGELVIEKRAKRSLKNGEEGTLEYSVDGPPNYFEQNGGANLVLGHSGEEVFHSADDSSISFPLFAQISAKAMHKFCLDKFAIGCANQRKNGPLINGKAKSEANRTKMKGGEKPVAGIRRRKKPIKIRKQVCPPLRAIGPVQIVGHRVHQMGSAMRRGNRWFLTEYGTGYSLFQFDLPTNNIKNESNDKLGKKEKSRRNIDDGIEIGDIEEEREETEEQQLAFPSKMHTLPEPFRGTDHTIGGSGEDETIFYELPCGQRIQSFHLGTGRRMTKLIYAEKIPLYGFGVASMDGTQKEGGTGSSIDLEFDQSNALWVLFQRPFLPDVDASLQTPPSFDFSALKLASGSLKELGQWNLRGLSPQKWANAFVACGILYKVELANTNNGTAPFKLAISPIFNFHSGKFIADDFSIENEHWTAAGLHTISNVQYDPETDSLSVFDAGKVLNVQIIREK